MYPLTAAPDGPLFLLAGIIRGGFILGAVSVLIFVFDLLLFDLLLLRLRGTTSRENETR